MKLIKLSIIALLLLNMAFADWKPVYKKVAPSIPVIVEKGICSGALIRSNLILTAAHCVWHFRKVSVTWEDDLGTYEEADIVAIDYRHDLALIKLRRPSGRKVLKLSPRGRSYSAGEEIATVGHPTVGAGAFQQFIFDEDFTYVLSAGVISKVTDSEYVTDLSLSPGNSGGPVFNKKGEIIAVATAKRIDRFVGNVGKLSRVGLIHELIDEYDDSSKQRLPSALAQSDFNLKLDFTSHTFVTKLQQDLGLDTHDDFFTFGFEWDIADRFKIAYAKDVSAKMDFYSFGFGWNFHHYYGNTTYMRLTPMFDFVKYKLGGVEKHANSWGLAARFNGFPMTFKLNYLNMYESTQWIFAVQIPMF
jgi:serine protease Do